eukprot:GSMAST32.ASY1.ANO1.1839.1 assembled CDS
MPQQRSNKTGTTAKSFQTLGKRQHSSASMIPSERKSSFKRKKKLPNTKVTNLIVYPIKSCGGYSVSSVELTRTGLRDDRRWMLINEEGRFQTQRQYPRLALVTATPVRENNRTIAVLATAPGMPRLVAPIVKDAPIVDGRVKLWDTSVIGARDQGAAPASWFCKFLGVSNQSLRLIYCDDNVKNYVPENYAVNKNKDKALDLRGFADGFPFLLTSESSLRKLNSWLIIEGHSQLPMNRFRPNIVIDSPTLVPFSEDNMKHIHGKSIDFFGVKKCCRCKITTTDQSSGKQGGTLSEPLLTLRKHRSIQIPGKETEVFFGMNLIHQYKYTYKQHKQKNDMKNTTSNGFLKQLLKYLGFFNDYVKEEQSISVGDRVIVIQQSTIPPINFSTLSNENDKKSEDIPQSRGTLDEHSDSRMLKNK